MLPSAVTSRAASVSQPARSARRRHRAGAAPADRLVEAVRPVLQPFQHRGEAESPAAITASAGQRRPLAQREAADPVHEAQRRAASKAKSVIHAGATRGGLGGCKGATGGSRNHRPNSPQPGAPC